MKITKTKIRQLIREEMDMLAEEEQDPPLIAKMRDVLENGYQKINGQMVDSFTASHIISLYDALSDSKKKHFGNLKLGHMVKTTWAMFKKIK